jgi:thioredoxin 1
MQGLTMALLVNTENFDREVKNSPLPVVIDMYATWCGPCKMMAPLFDQLAKDLGDHYKFVKINIDEERDIAVKYNVSSIPTFLFLKDGQLVAKETGYMSKDALTNKITAHLG